MADAQGVDGQDGVPAKEKQAMLSSRPGCSPSSPWRLPPGAVAVRRRAKQVRRRVGLGQGLGINSETARKATWRIAALTAVMGSAALWQFCTDNRNPSSGVKPVEAFTPFRPLDDKLTFLAGESRILNECCACEEDNLGMYFVSKQHLTKKATYNAICARGDVVCLQHDSRWMIVLYFFGIFYMFMALAIICEEFFVPSLESFCEKFSISPDVAGATFMAAGGSMPELATSFIGTWKESSIGIAAIVGSAVFNVLFVIAVCAVAATEAVELTPWPLARDCTYYMLSLIVLALSFSGPWSPDRIDLWEAVIMFILYLGYCYVMKKNEKLAEMFAHKMENCKVHPETETEVETDKSDKEKRKVQRCTNTESSSMFRNGVIARLVQHEHVSDAVGMAVVLKISGGVEAAFEKIAADSTTIDSEKIQQLLELLKFKSDDRNVAMTLRHAPKTQDCMTYEDFQKWYGDCKARIFDRVPRVFDELDINGDNEVEIDKVKCFLESQGFNPSERDLLVALEHLTLGRESSKSTRILESATLKSNGDMPELDVQELVEFPEESKVAEDCIRTENGQDAAPAANKNNLLDTRVNFKDFMFWCHTFLLTGASDTSPAEEDEDGEFNLKMPNNSSRFSKLWYFATYPICAAMYVTLPDVRKTKVEKVLWIAFLEFGLSLVWIAIFSICLVEWTEVISNSMGVPIPVAGITILAAGTSIPDLLSSYIVARQGEGDMAVSSSVGSNIFDVTVGLPLPWILWSSFNGGKSVPVEAEGIGFFISLLVMMIALVVITIKVMGWKLNRALGITMFTLYFVFIALFLLVQMPEGDPILRVPF